VVAQSAAFALVAALVWLVPVRTHAPVVRGIALVVAAAGLVLFVSAYRSLGRSFTPFPRPLPTGEFVSSGPFQLVRHPTYGGLLLLLAGVSLAFGLAGLIGTAVLAVLWWRKTLVEERFLVERFPEYEAYRRRVRRRFLPWLL
jgi:protein-S-isoprenylcysteine O-methyltransferase Ste14